MIATSITSSTNHATFRRNVSDDLIRPRILSHWDMTGSPISGGHRSRWNGFHDVVRFEWAVDVPKASTDTFSLALSAIDNLWCHLHRPFFFGGFIGGTGVPNGPRYILGRACSASRAALSFNSFLRRRASTSFCGFLTMCAHLLISI